MIDSHKKRLNVKQHLVKANHRCCVWQHGSGSVYLQSVWLQFIHIHSKHRGGSPPADSHPLATRLRPKLAAARRQRALKQHGGRVNPW